MSQATWSPPDREASGDPLMASSVLDRLTQRCHILVFDGESYRLNESRRRHESIDTARNAPKTPTTDTTKTSFMPAGVGGFSLSKWSVL